MPLYLMILKKLNLFDIPDKERKLHINPTPRLGGLIISLIFILVIAVVDLKEILYLKYFLIGGFLMFIIGFIDDIFGLEWSIKLIFQFISLLLLLWNIIKCCSFKFFLMGFEINTIIGYLLLAVIMLGIVNSFNLIDGMDGLLTTYTCLVLFFILLNNDNDSNIHKVMIFSLLGLLLGFILYNQNPARIFLGDSGSLILGYLLIFLYINSISNYRNEESIRFDLVKLSILFSLPMIDTVRLIFVRLTNGRSPFLPDRNHIHHIFQSRGFTTNQIIVIICLLTLLSLLIYLIYLKNMCLGFLLFVIYVIAQFFIDKNPISKINTDVSDKLKKIVSNIKGKKIFTQIDIIIKFIPLLLLAYLFLDKIENLVFKPTFFENDTFTLLIIYLSMYLLISIKMKHKPKSEILIFGGLLSLFYLFITNDFYREIEHVTLYGKYRIYILFSIILSLSIIIFNVLKKTNEDFDSPLSNNKKNKVFNVFDLKVFFMLIVMFFVEMFNHNSIPGNYILYFIGLMLFYFYYKIIFSQNDKYNFYFNLISIFFASLNIFFI